MTVKKVWAVYFSGTGTTKKTVDRIAHRLAEALGTDCEVYDYTLPAARRQELTIPSGDVAVVGCPTYAGRVPNLLMPYLRGYGARRGCFGGACGAVRQPQLR